MLISKIQAGCTANKERQAEGRKKMQEKIESRDGEREMAPYHGTEILGRRNNSGREGIQGYC